MRAVRASCQSAHPPEVQAWACDTCTTWPQTRGRTVVLWGRCCTAPLLRPPLLPSKRGQTTAESLARVVEGESSRQGVLNACSLLELALATGTRRCVHNEINVGAPSGLFVECCRPTSSEPTYEHWSAVSATAMPGQCKNFARLRYFSAVATSVRASVT